jgi:hypothetical protein
MLGFRRRPQSGERESMVIHSYPYSNAVRKRRLRIAQQQISTSLCSVFGIDREAIAPIKISTLYHCAAYQANTKTVLFPRLLKARIGLAPHLPNNNEEKERNEYLFHLTLN